MRRLSQKRLLRLASLILTGLTVVFGILWVVRGLRPAIACGVLDYLGSGEWSAAFACVDQADYEALLFVVGLAASAVAWLASRNAPDTPMGEYHPTPREQANNRKGMIDRVWSIWIEGHLEQTLYQAVLMSLGMTLRPVAPRPGSVRLRRAGEQERPVPEHVSTVQLFDQAGHTLLILGEPGSGKTTMMLDLARSLLERAKEDESTPIPVVFNLSSLTDPEQSLDDWLVGEFRSNYQVPEKVARYWLAHDELALLLDGLDEVRADRRAGVVEKIDHYRSQHMDRWLVVCCRQSEYAELASEGSAVEDVDAVFLQPLTAAQIKGYLADLAGHEPERLWRALQDDAVLLELTDTPLILNVMLLAAERLDWSVLPSDQGSEVVRSHIYDGYIKGMLARPRNTGRRYPDEKTVKWLHWLAGKMVTYGHTVFLLERMKQSWLNRSRNRPIWATVFQLTFGLVLGLLGALINGSIEWLVVGFVGGWSFGLVLGRSDIEVNEMFRYNIGRKEVVNGLAYALICMLVGWAILRSFVTVLMLGLISMLGYWFGFRLLDVSTALERDFQTSQPNAGIRHSMCNGLLVVAIVWMGFAFVSRLGNEPNQDVPLFFGLSLGLFLGLYYGLGTAIKHYTLRLVLFLDGSMPLNYVRFLDYCVDRVLLRRVGGGYIFIHRTMMEHIAALDLEKWKDEPG